MDSLRELIGKKILIFDGAMGTQLQARGLQPGELPETWNFIHPEAVLEVQRAYLQAGANLLKTNSFGANGLKYRGSQYSVSQIVTKAVQLAKQAAEGVDGAYVCLDIGPLGKLLRPFGDLEFEDAVSLFAEQVRAGAAAGADAVLIETMSDTYEVKAALLAAKENCSLPVFVTMTFDVSGKLLTGADVATAARLAESLGADAVGFNCGLGPKQLLPLVEEMLEAVSLPVIVNPNAGLPVERCGKTCFEVGPQEFAQLMLPLADAGVAFAGGCCGTTPEHIGALVRSLADRDKCLAKPKLTGQNIGSRLSSSAYCTSYGRTVLIGKEPQVIGERINPTGKKRLQEALHQKDLDYVCRLGLQQIEAGAKILDVNVGTPGVDETNLLAEAVVSLQSVTDVPLQIDTTNPVAMERALRLYNGVPLLNSVNGSEASLKAVLPLAAKYGATLIALTFDEQGIPKDTDARLRIAERIMLEAEKYGIRRQRIVVDPLTLTVGTGPENGIVTLNTLQRLSAMGVSTLLGVSNISFGLPEREVMNTAFFTLALQSGLSLAIINPQSRSMMGAYYAFRALQGLDENFGEYVKYAECNKVGTEPESRSSRVNRTDSDANAGIKSDAAVPSEVKAGEQSADPIVPLYNAIVKGLTGSAREAAGTALQQLTPLELIDKALVPALNYVGEGFERKTVFLPQLLMSADAAKAAFEVVRAAVGSSGQHGPVLVLATVQGDVHDIGKNIVKALLENYGFTVVDLGKDVPPERIVAAVREHGALIVGLAALMTTTVRNMERTIEALHQANLPVKIMVGGAVLTAEYASRIGADGYAANAVAAVHFAQENS